MKKVTIVWNLIGSNYRKYLDFTSAINAYYFYTGLRGEMPDMSITKSNAIEALRRIEKEQSSYAEQKVFVD